MASARRLIAEREGEVRAFVALTSDEPLFGGGRSDAKRTDTSASLAGHALAVKDLLDVAGLPTGCGSPIHAKRVATTTATCVERALDAGLVCVGKTKMTEFATFEPCDTRNPLNLAYTPGGSSSGSAAAVAAGMADVALGTQTAGSVIRPAAYCGVVGLLPTFGTVPTTGLRVLSPSLDRIGVFARDIDDALALVRIVADIAGPARIPSSPLRIGFFAARVWAGADPVTRATIDRAETVVRELGGVTVALADAAPLAALTRAQETLMAHEVARALAPELAEYPEMISARLHAFCASGLATDEWTRDEVLAVAARGRDWIATLFDGVDAIACPAAKTLPPATLASTGDPYVNRVWSLLGCPCVTLPTAALASGLRGALQLVGPIGDDLRLAGIAQDLAPAVRGIHA